MQGIERVTGRKARVPKKRKYVARIRLFFLISLLSGRGKQTTSMRIFSSSLQNKKEVSFIFLNINLFILIGV